MIDRCRPGPLAATASLAVLVLASPGLAQDLALKRVMLSTGGVGYLEYEAEVEGPAELALLVRRDQVDDVLKSLVAFDDKGGIASIALPGEEPLADAFRELRFGPESLESPVALLAALRGSEVRIEGGRGLAGRLVAVVPEQVALPANGGTTLRHRITIAGADGLQNIILEEVERLQFADPKLQQEVADALAAMARQGQREQRRIAIRSTGAERRLVRVGYLVEAPLWKASYRLTLDADPAAPQAALQGWAVLENRTGADWRDIELTLVSGNPVTFRQALYSAYYVDRPEVPVEVLGRVLPRPDPGGIPAAPEPESATEPATEQSRPKAAPAESLRKSRAAMAPADAAPVAPTRSAELAAAESTEATTQVSFRLAAPVSIASGHSVLVPIIGRPIPTERLAQYQPATEARRPLAAIRLTNDGESALPPGVVTLYERGPDGRAGYLGDARLSPLPPGERRLVSYAVDQKVKIDRERRDSTRITRGSIADGRLTLEVTERQETVYTLAGPPGEPRRVLIEHPRPAGDWRLAAPDPSAAEILPDAFRLTQALAPGATAKLTVALQRPVIQRLELGSLDPDRLALYAAATELGAEQRKALTRLSELSAGVAGEQRRLGDIERQRRELDAEQARVRSNLGAVPPNSDLQKRYLRLLSQQEDQIAKIMAAEAEAREALDKARRAFAEAVKEIRL